MGANQKQVGGRHYKTEYEHWDFVILTGIGYLEGCTTKYIARWRNAEGIMDLEKSVHYLEKLIECYDIYDISDNRMRPDRIREEVTKFGKINGLLKVEEDYIFMICTYSSREDLMEAMALLQWIVSGAEAMVLAKARNEEPTWPGTPEDGGHHAKQEPV